MRLFPTEHFRRDFVDLPSSIQKRVARQLDVLLANPLHPSLRLKKMMGHRDVWEVRVTDAYRVTLSRDTASYILRRVGSHDILRKP